MKRILRSRPLRIMFSALALATLGLSGVGIHRTLHGASSPADTARAAPASALGELWPVGSELVYGFGWSVDTETDVSGMQAGRDTAKGSVALAGEMSITPLGREGDETILALGVRSLSLHRVHVLDADALATDEATAATFDGQSAFVRLAPDGTVRRVDYAKGTPVLFQHLATGLASAVGISVRSGEATWKASEPTSLGRASIAYARADEGSVARIVRSHTGYESLTGLPPGDRDPKVAVSGTGCVALDPRGMPARIEDHEAVRVTRPDGRLVLDQEARFEATLLRVGPAVASLAKMPGGGMVESRVPGRAESTAIAEARALDQQIAGLGAKELFADLDEFALLGHEAIPSGWLTRATALLTKDPKLCAEIVARIQDPALRSEGRVLFVEILAATGTPDAQAAMRRALDLPIAHDDARAYRLMMQRFSLVQNPDATSIRYVADLHARARAAGDEDARVAALYALGGVVHAAGGSTIAAREASNVLRAEVHAEQSVDSKRKALFALGNAGLADAATITADARRDRDPVVRAAAARALRRVPARDAREALVALAQDSDVEVQREALASLGATALASSDATSLAHAVEHGATAAENDALVVGLLGDVSDDAPVQGALRAILARSEGQPQLAAQVRMLLARSPG